MHRMPFCFYTGCSYNNINYFGDDSVTESKYYFGENEEQDAKITAAYAPAKDTFDLQYQILPFSVNTQNMLSPYKRILNINHSPLYHLHEHNFLNLLHL